MDLEILGAESMGVRSLCCAADFMGLPRRPLEAERAQLYERLPVPDGWHDDYTEGRVNPDEYLGTLPHRDA